MTHANEFMRCSASWEILMYGDYYYLDTDTGKPISAKYYHNKKQERRKEDWQNTEIYNRAESQRDYEAALREAEQEYLTTIMLEKPVFDKLSQNYEKEHVDLTRAESMIEPKRKARIDLSTVQTRSPADAQKDLDLRWGNGIKMDWHYVPKEEQKCHINWRQSINDDGAGIQRLSSFPMNESNAGYNMTKNGNGVGTSIQQNRDAIESSNVPEISYARDAGKRTEGSRDDCINRCAGTELNKVRKAVGSMNTIDPLTVACIAYIEGSSDYAGIASKLQGIASKLGVSNTAIIVAAYGTGTEVFLGKGSGAGGKGGNPPRIDVPLVRNEIGGDNPSEYSEDPADDPKFNLKWESASSWLWADFGKRFTHRAAMCGYSVAQCSLLPKVCYLYVAIAPFCKSSRFDSDKYFFPFDDAQIAKGTIYYVSPFGDRSDHFHRGIDLAAPRGTLIHAVHDGTVTEANDGNWSDWAAINIDHGDGTYSRYLHCNSMSVRTGERVTKGQVIGTVGGDMAPTAPIHTAIIFILRYAREMPRQLSRIWIRFLIFLCSSSL